MNKKGVFRLFSVFFLLFLLFGILFLFTQNHSFSAQKNPMLYNGQIDLSEIDFSHGEKVYLQGEVQFYRNQLLVADKESAGDESQALTIPGYWDVLAPNLQGERGGYGSYCFEVTGITPGKKLVVFFPNHWGAYRAYLDGKMIAARGMISTDLQELVYQGETLLFPQIVSDLPRHEIIIEYATDSISGLDACPILMEYGYAQEFLEYTHAVNIVMSTILIISFGILFVYYMLIGFRHYQWAMSVLVLSICLRYSVFNSIMVIRWLWELHPFLNGIAIMALTFVAKISCALFYREEMKLEIPNKVFVGYSIFYLVLLGVFSFVPMGFYETYLDAVVTLTIYSLNFYMLWNIYLYLQEGKPYGILYMVSYIFLTTCFAMENYFYNGFLRSDLNLFAPVCVLMLIFMFIYLTAKKMVDFYEMERSMLQMQEDLNHHQISLMMSQIRPHFLYNALTAIQCLCRTDPAKAEKALIQFSRYLRANLAAINSQEYIPFTDELNHIDNYLAIEKLRFGERLEVSYEIEDADFVVPALSIQPIVENAVKHGISKKLGEGHVLISSRRTDSGYEIVVTDDGVGFDTTRQSSEKSYGIRNITSRIQAMNGSRIEFHSQPGVGTEVVVHINT